MQAQLLTWARRKGRDLPWRHTRDPWAILVSEVMLQQTQVTRVIPAWTAFLTQFPTPRACADAGQAAVVTAWDGLGYNRRAVNLHRCALTIVDRYDAAVPDTLDALLTLPGIGAYTARAVLAFAFEQPVGIVDVNVARVHARLAGRALNPRELQRVADAATPRLRPWHWNQAMLDLGATVCTKRAPSCERCPLTAECGWHAVGGEDPAGPGTRQPRFEGSDRQGRGRLVAALRRGPLSIDPSVLAETMGWPEDEPRSLRVAMSVVTDGLAKWEEQLGTISLR